MLPLVRKRGDISAGSYSRASASEPISRCTRQESHSPDPSTMSRKLGLRAEPVAAGEQQRRRGEAGAAQQRAAGQEARHQSFSSGRR